jgi:pimeloyl-ACP methyl ester carboxylesterase
MARARPQRYLRALVSAPTLVLVHGAFHGPWCFELVRPLLHERGITTAAPTLEFTSLADDVAIVTRALDELEGPAVLLGHSYGGNVITSAGEHAAVTSLIYLTAGVPDIGEGIGSGSPGDERSVPEGFSINETGEIVVDGARAAEVFYPDADPVTAAGCVRRLRAWRTVAGQSCRSLRGTPTLSTTSCAAAMLSFRRRRHGGSQPVPRRRSTTSQETTRPSSAGPRRWPTCSSTSSSARRRRVEPGTLESGGGTGCCIMYVL